MTLELQTLDRLRDLLREPLIAQRNGELRFESLACLSFLQIHPRSPLQRLADPVPWTFSCPEASPAVLAELERHAAILRTQYDVHPT